MTRIRLGLLIGSLSLLAARPAAADLVLSLDRTTYDVVGVGATTTVQVLLSQTAGGVQVGPGHELGSAGIVLSFATAGAATVASTSDVTPGSAWDIGGPDFSTSGPNTLINLGLLSILGASDLSSPVLLGTFTFTAQSTGSTTITVSSLTPGSSFSTVNGDILNSPASVSGTITVSSGTPAVPEPSSLALAATAGLFAAFASIRRRRSAR